MKNLRCNYNQNSLIGIFLFACTQFSTVQAKPINPAHEPFEQLSADEALHRLVEGNDTYRKLQQRLDGLGEKDRVRNLGGQHPHSIILSCSDSRVPPEIVFDQRLGDLFVVRTAG